MHNDGIASGCDVIPPQMAKRVKRWQWGLGHIRYT
jgi:hypothetical protein